MNVWLYPVEPSSAPRQTQRDRWRPSPPVLRYRAYKDELKLKQVSIPRPFHHLIFILKAPKSWSAKKVADFDGKPHEQKPDRDNLEKAVLDALLPESDCMIWNGSSSKVWGRMGGLIVCDEHAHIPSAGIPYLTMAAIHGRLTYWRLNEGARELPSNWITHPAPGLGPLLTGE